MLTHPVISTTGEISWLSIVQEISRCARDDGSKLILIEQQSIRREPVANRFY